MGLPGLIAPRLRAVPSIPAREAMRGLLLPRDATVTQDISSSAASRPGRPVRLGSGDDHPLAAPASRAPGWSPHPSCPAPSAPPAGALRPSP